RAVQAIRRGFTGTRSRELIRQWHPSQRLLHINTVADGGAEWIAECLAIGNGSALESATAEQIDCGQISCCACRSYRIFVPVDRWTGIICISIIDARKVPKDSLPRHLRQCGTNCILAFEVALTFKQ